MLEIKNVVKKYGNKVATNDISLNIKEGEIFGFVGPNGAGKTTLIKSIVGIHNFDSGDILLDGISIKDNPLDFKKNIAYIPDNPDIYLNIKGIDYLNFIADIFGVSAEDRTKLIQKYSKMFEIDKNLGDVISSYSHGMRQKLVIIGALIHKPRLLVLDEPFVGLDPTSTKLLKDMMHDLAKEKVTIFFSSHVLEVVEKLCDRVAIIKDGSVLAFRDKDSKESLEDYFMEKVQ